MHPIMQYRRFKGCIKYPPGSVSDDTEMTLALAWTIMASTGYDQDKATLGYMQWVNSGCPFLGHNTRDLFLGIKTTAGYEARRAKKLEEPVGAQSQSNGFLMRASPLAILPEDEWRAAAAADCSITNFPLVCQDAATVYVGAVRDALQGLDRSGIFERACEAAQTPEVEEVLMQVADGDVRDVDGLDKGWCLHGLYAAFLALHEYQGTYQDTIDTIMSLGGDSDTNASDKWMPHRSICGRVPDGPRGEDRQEYRHRARGGREGV